MKRAQLKKALKPALVIGILAVTLFLFARYIHAHPEYVDKLRHIDPIVIVWLMLANSALIATVAVINHVSAHICKVALGKSESLLLTIYSSLANFFGPLQSGPGVRAVYLKSKYKVLLRDFTFVTLISYGVYACTSALFLAVGVLAWWKTLAILLAVGLVSAAVITVSKNRGKKGDMFNRLSFTPRFITILVAATILQVAFTAVRYGIELHAVGSTASVGQIISYAGAANFALFVSLTPDGIGIREAFLLFSQQLHGVPTNDIIAASLVDRAAYVIFLALLGIIAASLHIGRRFSAKPADSKEATH